MKLLKQFIQQETVLTAAAVLAVVSAFFVPPDAQYLGYIDLRTLAILFSLMTVMAGLRRQGFFDGLGRALLSRTHSTFQLTLVLVGLCFFGSMFITNDVSLLTFVPFTFVVLSRLGADVRRSLLVPVVCMQTIAANLGSMLTPIGNPQNLYLYGKSGMSIGGFVLLMLPYTLVSLLLLLAWAAMVCRKASAALSVDELVSSASQGDQKIILLYLVLFAVCLLSVIRVLPYGIAFAAVLVCVLFADPHTLRAVDYSLLLTFVAFFIFIGNLGRIPAFSGWLQEFLTGREVLVLSEFGSEKRELPGAGFVKSRFFGCFRLIFDRFLQIFGLSFRLFDFSRLLFRFHQQIHLGYLPPHIPHIRGEERHIPDAILWSGREKSSVIVSSCRVCDSVTDDYISSAAHEAALDVAHQAHNKVNVLGYDKDFVVVADISALADIQKGQQCCARSASRV